MARKLAVAYVAAVAAVTALHLATGHPTADSLALTPDRFVGGQLWELVTSAFLVAGPPVSQVLVLGVLAAVLVQRRGARSFWLVAIAAHVGSTVVTYAGVGVLWLAHAGLVDRLLDQPDYGISCVWAGALGALVGDELARGGRARRVAIGVLAASVLAALGAVSSGLALPEHVLAFVLGALAIRLSPAPPEQVDAIPDRPGPRPVLPPQLQAAIAARARAVRTARERVSMS